MRIVGPESYALSFDSESFQLEESLSGSARSKLPKLYIVSVDRVPIYVGITKQPIRNRLRSGWKADGKNGYYGYAWRHHINQAQIDLWFDESDSTDRSLLNLETIEAEVVFLIRKAGQWPEHQTEIHFHPSSEGHREIAARIMGHYRSSN